MSSLTFPSEPISPLAKRLTERLFFFLLVVPPTPRAGSPPQLPLSLLRIMSGAGLVHTHHLLSAHSARL
jgi:hypothetical protein